MRTALLSLGAALNMYLSATAIASAQANGSYLCHRYGLYCASPDMQAASLSRSGMSEGLLAVGVLALTVALIWEITRRRA